MENLLYENISYNEALLPYINETCERFFKYTGLTTFAYISFHENQYFKICNNHLWLTHFIENCYHEKHAERYLKEMKSIPESGYYAVLRVKKNERLNDELTDRLRHYEIDHALSLYIKSGSQIEIFNFASHPHNERIWEFYLNNIEVIKKFSAFMHEKINHYCDERTLPSPLLSPMNYREMLESSNNEGEVEKETWDNVFHVGGRTRLTYREIQCLGLLAHGKTAKEIASILLISPRTVECHLSCIRLKLGGSKTQAIQYFWKSDLYWAWRESRYV